MGQLAAGRTSGLGTLPNVCPLSPSTNEGAAEAKHAVQLHWAGRDHCLPLFIAAHSRRSQEASSASTPQHRASRRIDQLKVVLALTRLSQAAAPSPACNTVSVRPQLGLQGSGRTAV